MSYLRLLIAALLFAAGPALAGPLENAEGAYFKKNYTTAMHLFRPLAQDGNARAQRMLGFMYGDGRGVPKDDQQAVFWFRKAAAQGDADSQSSLGYMYAFGIGLAKDYSQAMVLFQKAADQGNANAQFHLSNMYAFGPVRRDYQQGYFWALLASASGAAPSVEIRDLIEKHLTPQQRAAAQADARNWKPTKQ